MSRVSKIRRVFGTPSCVRVARRKLDGYARRVLVAVLGSLVLAAMVSACAHKPVALGGADDPGDPDAAQSPLSPRTETLTATPVTVKELPAMDHSGHHRMQH